MINLHKKLLVILFAVVIVAFPIATFATLPQEKSPFSENENKFFLPYIEPDFGGYFRNFFNGKPNNIKDRRFMNRFDQWFSDRFVLREDWIILKNELDTLSGKTEINEVFNVGDKLILAWRGEADEVTGSIAGAVDGFAERLRDTYEIDSYVMLVPSAQEVYKDLLPPNAQPGSQAALIKFCYDNMPSLTHIDVATYLAENANRYIYYRTDHHWNTDGAYWGYFAAAQKLGFSPHGSGRFNIEHASTDFRGTLFSKTLNFKITPDSISLYTLAVNPPALTLTVNTGAEITVHDTLYMREFLDKKDKYAVFLGLNSPIMTIETDLDNDKSLLIFKDSFAHCMIPFLANHYSRITVLDMRYLNDDVRKFVEIEEYEQVLFLFEATNFAQETSLRRLDSAR
jgi:hypothetical protein